MISLTALFCIFAIHWVADFVLQTHEQAMNKSSSNIALVGHTFSYSMVWFAAGAVYAICNIETYQHWHVSLFFLITFASHTVTDWFTSRWCKRYFSVGNYHNGFVVVGLDQMLHYAQLILCYIWLK